MSREHYVTYLLLAQNVPVKPLGHAHVKVLIPSVHTPSFLHGLGSQSLVSGEDNKEKHPEINSNSKAHLQKVSSTDAHKETFYLTNSNIARATTKLR